MGADFVLIEPHLLLAELEVLLDGPALTRHAHERVEWHHAGSEHELVVALVTRRVPAHEERVQPERAQAFDGHHRPLNRCASHLLPAPALRRRQTRVGNASAIPAALRWGGPSRPPTHTRASPATVTRRNRPARPRLRPWHVRPDPRRHTLP